MKYGFVSFEAPLRQQDGFFVDDQNRILYWPTKKAPGFLLDEISLSEIKNKLTPGCFAHVLMAVLAVIVEGLISISARFLFPSAELWFSSEAFSIAVLVWFVAVFALLSTLFHKWNTIPKCLRLLHHLGGLSLTTPRPEACIPKFSEVHGWASTIVTTFGCFLAGLAFTGMALGLQPIGDRLTAATVALSMYYLSWTASFHQLKGLRTSETRFVQQGTLESAKPLKMDGPFHSNQTRITTVPATSNAVTRKSDSLGTWIKWSPLALGAIGLAAIPFIPLKETLLTRDELLSQYRIAAFPASQQHRAFVQKWMDDRIVVCVGPTNETALRNDAIEQIQQYAQAAKLAVDLRERECNVEIQFVHDRLLTPEGRSEPAKAFFYEDKGRLGLVSIQISPVAINDLNPYTINNAGRQERRELDQHIAATVAMWSFGLRAAPDKNVIYGKYLDTSGSKQSLTRAVIAIHYNQKIRPGMDKTETMRTADQIVSEL